ncbi:hypothetical protein VTO42DRAFT_2978 [Malbranchea cinnamomea]
MASDAEALAELLDSPAMEPPEGVTPNFDNPPNRNTLAIVIITVTLGITTVCFLLRAYYRLYLLRKVQIQDFFILSAFGINCGLTYCCYELLDPPGYFVHQWDLKLGQLVPASYNVLLIGSFYQVVLPLMKTAILLDWLYLFAPQGKRVQSPFWWGCVSIITLQIVWGIACVILLNVQCTPHEAIWKFYLPRKCYNLVPVQLTSGGVQLLSDVVMLLLPQRVIWTLKLSWRKKLGVSLCFSLGILACISAGFRLGVTVNYGYDPDQMYQLAPVVFWVLAETTCGFLIVIMPSLPKLIRESGLSRSIKKGLGMNGSTTGKASTGANSKYYHKYGTGVSSLSRNGATADAYHMLDEENGVALDSLKTESTEQLRQPEYHQGQILRKTQVSVHVTSDRTRHWGG